MIRVLVCGEGKHDVGVPDEATGTARSEGWLQIVLRKLLGKDTQFWAIRRAGLVLQRREQQKYRPLPKGHGAKALVLKLRAKQEGYDLVVFMADGDTNKRKIWEKRRKEILDGFGRLDGVKNVPCVPMSASESWLLADDQAWTLAGLRDLALLPNNPEKIWGSRDDPDGDHPHHYFHRVCRASGVDDALTARTRIAELSEFQSLKRSCPISFVAFVNDLAEAGY